MADTIILDGGMSRELLRLGAELKQPEWSALALMNSPEIVRQVHEEFIAAGADVVTTNSYALVPFHIGEERFRKDGPALIALAGQLAREAADGACRKVVVAGSPDARHANEFGTDLIMVEGPNPGSGKVFDWSLVEEVAEGPRIILAGGLNPDNVGEAVRTVRPWGVDAATGVEKSPGKKDALKVKAFIERARAAAPERHLGPDVMPYDWADDDF